MESYANPAGMPEPFQASLWWVKILETASNWGITRNTDALEAGWFCSKASFKAWDCLLRSFVTSGNPTRCNKPDKYNLLACHAGRSSSCDIASAIAATSEAAIGLLTSVASSSWAMRKKACISLETIFSLKSWKPLKLVACGCFSILREFWRYLTTWETTASKSSLCLVADSAVILATLAVIKSANFGS